MKERAKTIGLIADMLQQADTRELDLVWRFLRGMLGGKEAQTQTEGSATQ